MRVSKPVGPFYSCAWRSERSGLRRDLGLALSAVVLAVAGAGCSGSDSGSSTAALESGTTTIAVAPAPTAASSGETTSPAPTPVVDEEFLTGQIEGVRVPDDAGSFMIAVLDSDGGVLSAEKGSDPDGNAPTPSSSFRIGSNTKTFTSLLTLMLVDDGLVDLEAPVADYVARVPVPDGVTVRDLLQHTSGIPNYTDSPDLITRMVADPTRVWTPEETAELIADRPPLFEPGARFSYSNTNYLTTGVLIEEVTGRRYVDVLRERIIEPFELDGTYLDGFETGTEPFGAYTSVMTGRMEPIGFDYTAIATNAWAAGAIVSTAEDLHDLYTAVFEGRVISDESLAAMIENEEYGFGVARLDDGLFGHNGGIPGYATHVAHAPDTGTTAFWVVTNDQIDFRSALTPVFERLRSPS